MWVFETLAPAEEEVPVGDTPAIDTPAGDAPALAATGADTALPLGLAGALLLAGALTLAMNTRRRTATL